MMDISENNILQVNMRGILSSNSFFNFLNYCRLRKNVDRKTPAQISKEAAELWLAMSPGKKMPFKRTALAVKKFRVEKARKGKGPYKVIGYRSYVTVDGNNRVRVKEMIAYTEPLKLNINWDLISESKSVAPAKAASAEESAKQD